MLEGDIEVEDNRISEYSKTDSFSELKSGGDVRD